MCSDNRVLSMMSTALNKTEAKLKKFCKFITVFEENINLSPNSIARKINGPICSLPENIRSTILDKFAEILPTKYVLLDWIDENKLNWTFLSQNLNAIDLLEKQINIDPDEIHWYFLSQNPNAIELLKKNKSRIHWDKLCTNLNLNVIKLLKKRVEFENTLAEEELYNLDDEEKINWKSLSKNPNAIDLLKKNYDEIDWNELSKNPNAIDLLKKRIEYEKNLSKVEYNKLKNKINWKSLSKNPNAIDLLKERIEYEKNLSRLKYNKLEDKINWIFLSANPNAIELLNENQDKINWKWLSENPAIFKAV